MSRKGVIVALNPRRGMVGIKVEDGGHTVVELLSDWPLDSGDVLEWANDYGLGHETYRNLSKGTQSEVFVQNHDVSTSLLPQQMLF